MFDSIRHCMLSAHPPVFLYMKSGGIVFRCTPHGDPGFTDAIMPVGHDAIVHGGHGATVSLCYGATVYRWHGATLHGAMVRVCHGARGPWRHGAMVPQCSGAMLPRCCYARGAPMPLLSLVLVPVTFLTCTHYTTNHMVSGNPYDPCH